MALVNHIKSVDSQNRFHTVAYGKHVVTGTLAKSIVNGTSPNHVITLQQMLGRGEWDGCEGLWFRGIEIKPDKYRFHPGKLTPHPTLKSFTADSSTDTITSTSHGFANGDIVIHRPGDLPAPLVAGDLYYVRDAAANTYKLATTPGGTAIDLTTNGSGTLQVYRNDPVQGIDPAFPTDTPHSGIAYIVAELPTGVGDANTKTTPPDGLRGIFRTRKCNNYDASGNVTGYSYTTNPARQVADLIIAIGGRPASRIDWPAWVDWRDYCDELINYDYTAISGFDGFGLTGSYYNGTAFNTLITQRIDPVLEFVASTGSPGVGVDVDNFSVRWEGKIKPKFSETFTFYVTHTHGVRVWINNLTTPLIDQWSTTGTHSATIALTAGQFYDIKVEWQHTTGTAEFRLEWASTSQRREVINHRSLYPKTAMRPRYETHPFFNQPTRLDDAVRVILNLCNSTVQEANGKLRFFSLEQLTEPKLIIDYGNVVDSSLQLGPRDVNQTRNIWIAKFRDVDSQYLEEPIDPLTLERDDLIDAAGRRIDGDSIELFNSTPHQASRTIDILAKRQSDPRWTLDLTGTARTFEVLPGDAVELNLPSLGLTSAFGLVVSANDASAEQTAEERPLKIVEWTLQELESIA